MMKGCSPLTPVRLAPPLLLLLAVVSTNGCSSGDAREDDTTDAEAVEVGPPESGPDGSSSLVDASVDSGPSIVDLDGGGPTVECASEPCVVQLSATNGYICALTSGGDVYCWGDNSKGQIGAQEVGDVDGGSGTIPAIVPSPHHVLSGARSVSAGATTACAVMDDGSVACWGGVGDGCAPSPTPKIIEGLPPMESVSPTYTSGCGVSLDHELWCWGENLWGMFAHEATPLSDKNPCSGSPVYPPVKADRITVKVREVATSTMGTAAITESGDLLSWGTWSAIGRTLPVALWYDEIPFEVPRLANVRSVSMFEASPISPQVSACAAANGEAYCWGWATPDRSIRAAALPPGELAIEVAIGGHTCIRTIEGTLYCMGSNRWGQLGDDTEMDSPLVPVKAEGLGAKVADVAVTDVGTCALLTDGQVKCWGGNLAGQLGQGTYDFYSHPKPMLVRFP